MKIFLKKALIFTALLLLLNIILFQLVNNLYYKPYLGFTHEKRPIVLLADSHGWALGNFLDSSGVRNFAMGSDAYSDMLRKIQYLLEYQDLNAIILTADDHTLSKYRETINNTDRSYALLRYSSLKKIEQSHSWVAYMKNAYLVKYLVLLNSKARDVLKAYIHSLVYGSRGTQGDWSMVKNKRHEAQQRAALQFPDTSISLKQRESLVSIINLCKNKGIEIVGLKFPLATEYLAVVDGRNYGADSIMKASGIEILDYSTVFAERDSFFANADHLNLKGAAELSRLIKDRIKLRGKAYVKDRVNFFDEEIHCYCKDSGICLFDSCFYNQLCQFRGNVAVH